MSRAFDVITSLLALIMLSPLLLLVATAVRAYDGGPSLYKARRVGRSGKLFEVYKFRTMVRDADRSGPGITASGDPRITPIGKLLRRTKLDEFPQLVNVVKGEMSIVGPRPEDPRYVATYTPHQRRILRARPGITSAASVRYRTEEEILRGNDWEKIYVEKVMPEKIAIDLEYLDRRTFWSDVQVILQTLRSLFR